MGEQVFGDGAALWVLQILTAGILILAANTAYADFPRLSSIVARDGYLPRQLASRGDRLVFSNGIVVLALMASALIVAFGGITNALIPLYAVGVFTSFTLSQSGMVRHHFRVRDEGLEGARRHQRRRRDGDVRRAARSSRARSSRAGAWIPLVVIPAIVCCSRRSSGTTTRSPRVSA